MRVIGGSARGRRLTAPRGRATRPTADRARQTLFDVLGQRCDEWRVLDLFAGSGALGIEALSRGASSCVFVERDPLARKALKKNVSNLGFEAKAEILGSDASQVDLMVPRGPFELVLADPPYEMGTTRLLERLSIVAPRLLLHEALVVLEHSRREEQPQEVGPLKRVDQRRFGETMLTFYTFEQDRQ